MNRYSSYNKDKMTQLPDDVLYLICTQLWHERDFNALFNCACSGKRLASIAATYLYRMQYAAPVTTAGSNEEIRARGKPIGINCALRLPPKERIFMRRAGLWRTIILSSLGNTSYPYSRYIRTLNLEDLRELLVYDENRARHFFQGELAQFKEYASSDLLRLHVEKTINRIGEAITKQTPLLEELVGNVFKEALSRWIPRLPRLTRLKPSHGSTVEGNGTSIRIHCLSFKGLEFQDFTSSNSHQGLAAFLKELYPQSLKSFEFNSCDDNLPEIFQALECHGGSLTELKLKIIGSDIFPEISSLKSCTNLVSLSLVGNCMLTAAIFHNDLHNYALLETVTWLKQCKKLRILSVINIFSALALITPILLASDIHLTSLKLELQGDPEFEVFVMRDAKKFRQALASQTSLQSLCLIGNLRNSPRSSLREADALAESLSKLVNLTELCMDDASDCFADQQILQLARSLPKLEVWSTDGFGLTDAVWDELASLRSLRSLTFTSWTEFTANGILNFIKKLGPGNNGLCLCLRRTSLDGGPSLVEQALIHKIIAKKLDGRFEPFQRWQRFAN